MSVLTMKKRSFLVIGFNDLRTTISFNYHKLIHCNLLQLLNLFVLLENYNRSYN